MENIARIFAVNLKNRRRALKLTQKELANKIEYSEKSISKWESGTSIAPSIILPSLAQALKVSVDDLFDNASEPMYYLGIDGGGTKTEFLLIDKNDNIVNHALLGTCNPVDIGIENALNVLNTGIMYVCENIPFKKVAVFAGIAGGLTGDYKNQIHTFLEKFHFCFADNGSDAQNAVAMTLGKNDGILVIAGTGNIAYSQIKGKTIRTGGFGYLFDEGGSGYAIGRDAILSALKAEEGSAKNTLLLDMIKKKCNSENVIPRIAAFYSGGKREIASYAPLVFEAYKNDDEVAKEILEKNMKNIAKIIDDAARHFKDDKVKVHMVGGISSQEDIILPIIKNHVKNADKYEFSICTVPTVNGALILAKNFKEMMVC